MVLDKSIIVKISKPNVRFYKEKYLCKVGDVISIDVSDLTIGSSELVLVECDVCGCTKNLIYRKYIKNINRQGYYTCSSKCSTQKKKNTFLKNFGYESPLKCNDIRDKVKNTCNIKYGVDNPMMNELVKDKVRNTCNLKYSSNYYVNSNEFKESMIDKYGVDNPMRSFEINNKRIKSSFEINEFESIKYQGKYELDFLKFCKEINVKPSKPNFSIEYILYGENKVYLPDFYLSDKNLVIEIKSTYYYNLHKYINILKKEYTINSGYEYIMILDKNYEEFKKLFNL